jgi:hypothetical protein
MGRLIAGVISLAVFICGAMYWSQAEQLNTMPSQPLCPGVTCADKAVTSIDNASAVAPAAIAPDAVKMDGCCKDKDAKGKTETKSEKKACCGGCCKDKNKDEKSVDA